MNRICSLFWVSVKPSWTTALLFWRLARFIRPAWRVHLQSRIPPKQRQLGSEPESRQDIYASSCSSAIKIIINMCLKWWKLLLIHLSQVILNNEAFARRNISCKVFYIVNLQSSGCSVTTSIQRTILENGRWLLSPKWLLTLNYTTKYWFSARTTRVEKLHANYKKLELWNEDCQVTSIRASQDMW